MPAVSKMVVALVALSATLRSAQAAEDLTPPQIVHEPCEVYKKGDAFTIWARFHDDSQIFDPKVIFRSGSDTWKNVSFTKEAGSDDFKAVIRARDLRGQLEYFIEVFDENGNGPARYGSPDAPVRVLPAQNPEVCKQVGSLVAPVTATASQDKPPVVVAPAPLGAAAAPGPMTAVASPGPAPSPCDSPNRPLYCSPLLWTAVGVVAVAGLGVGAYYLAFANKDEGQKSSTRYVRVTITAPGPTTSALAGAR